VAGLTLQSFLRQVERSRFQWGSDDCCLMLANWAVFLGYEDPAAELRGRYRTALGCARVLSREGGVLAVVSGCAGRIGLSATAKPQAGDVGVIEAATEQGGRAVGAICTGPRWVTRGELGVVVLKATPLAAWRV